MARAFSESCELHDESEVDRHGIAFGSYDVVDIEDARMTTAANSDHASKRSPRQRERRHAVADLVTLLSRAIDRRYDISTLRSVFEETLRRIVPVRSVQLREGS